MPQTHLTSPKPVMPYFTLCQCAEVPTSTNADKVIEPKTSCNGVGLIPWALDIARRGIRNEPRPNWRMLLGIMTDERGKARENGLTVSAGYRSQNGTAEQRNAYVHITFRLVGFLLWVFIALFIRALCLTIYITWLFSPLSLCLRSVVLVQQPITGSKAMGALSNVSS